MYLYFNTKNSGSKLSVDWIAVRKYAATEPTLALITTAPNKKYVWTDANRAGSCSFGVNYAVSVPTSDIGGLATFGVNYGFTVKGDLTGNVAFTVRYGFLVDGKVVTPTQGSLVIGGTSRRDLTAKMWTAGVRYNKAETGGPTSTIFDKPVEIYVPDHNGVSRCIFAGFYPSQTATYTPGNKHEEFVGYSYDQKLQYVIWKPELLLLKAIADQDLTNYQRLDFDNTVNNFTTGRWISGGTSGATARIVGTRQQWIYGTGGESYLVPENSIVLTEIDGTFLDDETITEVGGSGEALVNGSALVPLNFGAAAMYPENWIETALGANAWATTRGVKPQRINPVDPVVETWTVKPAVQWSFQSEETIQQAIDDIAKYHNFIFLVKWKLLPGYSTYTPCAYFVHQDDIDNPEDYALTEHRGLDLPAEVTFTFSTDKYVIGDITCKISGDSKYNQVIIRCQDLDTRTWYESTRIAGTTESAGVYYNDEIACPYPNITDQNLVSQADVDAAAALLYSYLSLRIATYEVTFARRTDLELLQKVVFSGFTDIPNDTYRIISIEYEWAAAAIFVHTTLIPDSQFKAQLGINRLYDNSTNEVRNVILNELAKLPKFTVSTAKDIDGNKVLGESEAGISEVSRDAS
jgi:hypothetical protein